MDALFETRNFSFPLLVNDSGRIGAIAGDDAIRAKIIQVLFTSRGERVAQPEFGCGLFDKVFDMNDPILAASVEFTIGQALVRWMADEIRVEGVNVMVEDETMVVEIAYLRKTGMITQAVRLTFS
jgi:uncharacterized protein